MSDLYVTGMPGVSAERLVNFKRVFRGFYEEWLSGGKQIDGTYSRDPSNTVAVNVLQPGLVIGKRTSGGAYAPSIIGLTGGALTSSGTSLTISSAVSTELARRIGATGTFKVTGPAAASGTVRTLTATYSALSSSAATITALGTNEVQRVDMSPAASGGNVVITFTDATTGLPVTTGTAAWSATDATFLANINSALDTATGVVGGIVATAISAVDTDLGFNLTFSGTGYAGRTHNLVSIATKPTSVTATAVSRTTTGASGAFVSGSFIQPTDGSETPLTFIGEESGGIVVTDTIGNNLVVPFSRLPIAGEVDAAQLINWPSDASLRTWLLGQLSTASGGKFIFGDAIY